MWPGEGVSYHGGRHNGGIDTGDLKRSERSLRPRFSFQDCVKHSQEPLQVSTRAGVGTDKGKKKCQISLFTNLKGLQGLQATPSFHRLSGLQSINFYEHGDPFVRRYLGDLACFCPCTSSNPWRHKSLQNHTCCCGDWNILVHWNG